MTIIMIFKLMMMATKTMTRKARKGKERQGRCGGWVWLSIDGWIKRRHWLAALISVSNNSWLMKVSCLIQDPYHCADSLKGFIEFNSPPPFASLPPLPRYLPSFISLLPSPFLSSFFLQSNCWWVRCRYLWTMTQIQSYQSVQRHLCPARIGRSRARSDSRSRQEMHIAAMGYRMGSDGEGWDSGECQSEGRDRIVQCSA